MAEIQKYRRTQYLIAKKFQLKYAGLILFLVFLAGTLCSYVVYYTMMVSMGDKLANVYPQGRLISIVRTVNLRMFVSLVLITPLVIIIGIYVSHKIAGPIYRIEKFLDAMANGDYSSVLTLRRKDELVALANGINRVLEDVKETFKGERAHLERSVLLVEKLKSAAGSKTISHSELTEVAEKLSEELRELNKNIEKYKI
jgi:methyl-accepting chemotaxis protein